VHTQAATHTHLVRCAICAGLVCRLNLMFERKPRGPCAESAGGILCFMRGKCTRLFAIEFLLCWLSLATSAHTHISNISLLGMLLPLRPPPLSPCSDTTQKLAKMYAKEGYRQVSYYTKRGLRSAATAATIASTVLRKFDVAGLLLCL